MTTNINNLQIQLQTVVNNTTETTYLLQLAKAIQSLNMGQIRTVTAVIDLPLASTHDGWLYFIEDDESLYFSDGSIWSPLTPSRSTIFSWGSNLYGQIGDGTTISRSSPVSINTSLSSWIDVAASYNYSLGLLQTGELWAWGYNFYGQLGDDTSVDTSSPVSVVGGFTDWCKIAAGYAQSLAIRQTGTLWAWGANGKGQLGDGTIVNSSSPVSVVGGFTDWCQMSTGLGHSVAVRRNGTAWTWGYNTNGQLGDNSIVDKSSPVSVVGGFTDWCQVSNGGSHSSAVRAIGTVWTWGNNSVGQLGDGTNTQRSSPVSVIGGFTDWCAISSNSTFNAAIRQNGTMWTWGDNSTGQLGDATIVDRSSPVAVVGGFTNWCQVSAGLFHTTAVKTDSTAWAWGCNGKGQLGDNTIINKSSPVSIITGASKYWACVSSGNEFSAGIVFL